MRKTNPTLCLVLLAVCMTVVLSSACLAQKAPSPAPPPPPLPCDAFKKNEDQDWVAKQDMTVPGPNGPVQIKAGTVVNDDLQDELDDRCK